MDVTIGYGVVSLVSFMLGILSGYVVRGFVDKMDGDRFSLPVNTFVLIVVTVIWAISMAVDIISPDYETSPFVHGLMGAIVGFFYKPLQRK